MPPSKAAIVRVTESPAPLLRNMTAAGHAFVSAAPCVTQRKLTVTGVRYQPYFVLTWALLAVAVIDGSLRDVDTEEPVKSVLPL